MPTVLRATGFEVRIYTDDHSPAHVHVFKAGAVVVIALDPMEIRRVGSMRQSDVTAAVRLIEANQEYLLAKWRDVHG